MDAIGRPIAVAALAADAKLDEDNIFDFSSGYLQRGMHLMPKSSKTLPWRLNQDYIRDRQDMRSAPVDDGVLRFEKPHAVVRADEVLEAAE